MSNRADEDGGSLIFICFLTEQPLLMKNIFPIMLMMIVAALLPSCEKAVFDDDNANGSGNANGNLTITVTNWRQVAYTEPTRAVVDITGYSSRLNFVIYKDGEKVKSLMQMQDDEGYGTVSFSLAPATYKVLVLAHSSKGNPTLASPENIKFTNTISFSDTFYYYGDVKVGDVNQTHELTLTRASSLLCFIIADEIPEAVAKIHFYYTGGSGVLNAVTGYGGDVDSKQEKLYNIEGLSSPLTLPIYTFLQTDEGVLKVRAVAKDKDNNVLLEREFDDIPMKRNMITEYSGSFFEHEDAFLFKAETDWGGTIRETY